MRSSPGDIWPLQGMRLTRRVRPRVDQPARPKHTDGSDTSSTATFAWLLGTSSAALVVDQVMAMSIPVRHKSVEHHVQLISLALTALAVAFWMYRTRHRRTPPTLVGVLLATTVLAMVQFVSRDTTAGSFMFYTFPVVYLAYHCRTRDALLGAGYASVACAAVALMLARDSTSPITLAVALHNSLYCPVVFMTVALLMSRLRQAQLRAYALVEQAASVDPLTGLATRKVFEEVALDAQNAHAAGMSLVLVDVDNFKIINDTHGHQVGDAALQLVAARLLNLGRPGDVACRLGGDEMALLLPGCPLEVARRRAEELVNHVATSPYSINLDGETRLIHVGVSAGVGHVPTGGELEDLYSAADASLYAAKHAGRGQVGSSRVL